MYVSATLRVNFELGDLAKVMQRSCEALSPRNVCVVMASLSRALAVLHSKSPAVIHRYR